MVSGGNDAGVDAGAEIRIAGSNVHACMELDPTAQFRSWLADCAQHQHLTHEQIARRSGVNRSTVTRLLNGHRGVTLDTALRLVQSLEAPMPPALTQLSGVSEGEERLRSLLADDPSLSPDAVTAMLDTYRALRQPAG